MVFLDKKSVTLKNIAIFSFKLDYILLKNTDFPKISRTYSFKSY